jgi:hypothetical protein
MTTPAHPAQCPKIPSEAKDIYRTPADGSQPPQNPRDRNNLRPLDEVTCYRVNYLFFFNQHEIKEGS